MLGAGLFAFSAFLTVDCTFPVFLHAFPLPFDNAVVLIHMETVPDTEVAGDIHAERTGHAIPAAGTAVLDTAVHYLFYCVYSFIFLFLHGNEIRKGIEAKRYFTITDLFYLAAVDITADKHVYITRYPMTGFLGIFPSRIQVISTTETKRVEYDGRIYEHYPVIGKPDDTPQFIEILRIANVILKVMGGENSCRYSSNCGNILLSLNYSA